jgi:alkanesulfonate monooxygenase SsuD/methylene tetrahydromethanopterin reductase-like flavin-dependent oxidoreductase (luciferase family)
MDLPDAPDLPALSGVMAEGYLPPGVPPGESIDRVRSAAEALSRDGDPIALLLSVTVPDDEVTLWFFAPATEAIAGRLVERAGLNVDRIVACHFGEGHSPRQGG